jgi:hypothetical protein
LECHGATRSRWTACTYTTSDSSLARRIPPAQLMFKGGTGVHQQLEAILERLRSGGLYGDLQWLSVATGDSGSCKLGDILNYLDQVLEPWGPGRRWRILICDVYAPQCDVRVTRLCWRRGYVLMWIGGGCTGALANPDVYCHDDLSRAYQELEMRTLIHQMELEPDKLPVPSREDCIRIFINAWMRPSLHLRAVEGNWKLMVRNDLGGTEDAEGAGDAKLLWDKLGVFSRRELVVKDVREEIREGRLPWTHEAVYAKLVAAFPKRGQLDEYIEGQEDEGYSVAEDRGALWDDRADPSPDISDVEEETPGPAGVAAAGPPAEEEALAEEASGAALSLAAPLAGELERIERLLEQERSEAGGNPLIIRALVRARHQAHKVACGRNQEDHRVAAAVMRQREMREAEKRFQQEFVQQTSEAVSRNERKRMRETQELQAAHDRTRDAARARAEREERQQERIAETRSERDAAAARELQATRVAGDLLRLSADARTARAELARKAIADGLGELSRPTPSTLPEYKSSELRNLCKMEGTRTMLRATEAFEWTLFGNRRWRPGDPALEHPVTALQRLLGRCCPNWEALHGVRYSAQLVLVERHNGVLDNCFLHGVDIYERSLRAAGR